MVGGALKRYFEKKGANLRLYDKGKNLGSPQEVSQADVVFVCVPTPFDKERGFDLSCVENACENLGNEKIVVLKSTMVPGTTEKLQEKYPQQQIIS